MERPCYCCDNSLIDPGTKENLSELTGALSELAVLSGGNEKCYKKAPCIEHHSMTKGGGLYVYQMNKKFVTDLVTTRKAGGHWSSSSSSSTSKRQPAYKKQQQPQGKEGNTSLKIKAATKRRARSSKPYEVPWYHKMEERTRTSSWNQENESLSTDEAASSSSSSSSNGNRSNPGSPSKSGRSGANAGLLRSRSLDDLTCHAWENEDAVQLPVILLQPKEEIENVSQQMRDLTVN